MEEKKDKRESTSFTVSWLQDTFYIDATQSQHHTLKTTLYEEYVRMCKANHWKPATSAVFGKMVKAAFPTVKTARLVKGDPGICQYYYKYMRRRRFKETHGPGPPSSSAIQRYQEDEEDTAREPDEDVYMQDAHRHVSLPIENPMMTFQRASTWPPGREPSYGSIPIYPNPSLPPPQPSTYRPSSLTSDLTDPSTTTTTRYYPAFPPQQPQQHPQHLPEEEEEGRPTSRHRPFITQTPPYKLIFWQHHTRYAQSLKDACNNLSDEALEKVESVVRRFWAETLRGLLRDQGQSRDQDEEEEDPVIGYLASDEFAKELVGAEALLYKELGGGLMLNVLDMDHDRLSDLMMRLGAALPGWMKESVEGVLPEATAAAKLAQDEAFAATLRKRAAFVKSHHALAK